MGDTDALRDKIAQAIHERSTGITTRCADGGSCPYHRALADAVLPVVTQQTAQALSLLRSRVEALADELDQKAINEKIVGPVSFGYRSGLRDAAQLLHRSLSDNKEQQ